MSGLTKGFNLLAEAKTLEKISSPVDCDNHVSATCSENRKAVERQIVQEIRKGNYKITAQKPKIVSSLGCIPKPGSEDVRLIHDASRPYGSALNDCTKFNKIHYTTIDEVVKLTPPNGYLAKVDLSQAYRSVPIAPSNYEYTGLKWCFENSKAETYMYDKRLPFGASPSPEIFQRVTESVVRMLARRGHRNARVYIDDFVVVGETKELCRVAFECLIDLLLKLGFSINWRKVIPPSQVIVFLGITIDSVSQTISLPDNKLCELKEALESWTSRTKATKRELQQLIGKLNWVGKLIRATRPFIRRCIDLMCTVKRPSHRVRLSKCVKEDIAWLNATCEQFNGSVVFLLKCPMPEPSVSTDASTTGGAAYHRGQWFYVNWSIDMPDVAEEHINVKELCVVLLAARKWCYKWSNKVIHIQVDNMVTLFAINKGTTKNSVALSLLRELCAILALYNIVIKASYIKSKDNVMADALSRLDDPDFAMVAAELLVSQGDLLLHPLYQWHAHMSFQTALYISQVCTPLSKDIWMRMLQDIEQPLLRNQQRQPMLLNSDRFYDSVHISDIKLSHVLRPPLPDMQHFWQEHSTQIVSQDI